MMNVKQSGRRKGVREGRMGRERGGEGGRQAGGRASRRLHAVLRELWEEFNDLPCQTTLVRGLSKVQNLMLSPSLCVS